MKPIVRWTVGNVSKMGIRCLDASVGHFKHLYGNLFDYYICYNQIKFSKIKFLNKYNIKFIDQTQHFNSLKIPPVQNHPCWKIYPPRIDKSVHEIFIDNDLVIYKKIPLIDFFLEQKDLFFITEGYRKSYGIFNSLIPDNFVVNTGFFGLPPHYDFKKDLDLNLDSWKPSSLKVHEDLKSKGHFDEQGLIAFILMNKKIKKIYLNEINIPIFERKFLKGEYGNHFVGINRKHIML